MMLPRWKPIKKRRTRIRRGKLTKKERAGIRLAVYERCGGRCELKLRDDCLNSEFDGPLPFKGKSPWDHWHMVHKKSEGAGGKTDLENCCGGCWRCHLLGIHRGETRDTKPVPAKVQQAEISDWTKDYYGN